MKTLALLFLAAIGLTGCVVAPLEPYPAVYAAPPAIVVAPHPHHRHYRHHRHRYWR